MFTFVLVFSFVALWHDLSFKLLAWGWLVSLFVMPEIAARFFLPPSKVRPASPAWYAYTSARGLTRYRKQYGDKPWYRHVCAAGGVLNILMMMTANLVGFVIGTDGIKYMVTQIAESWDGACVPMVWGVARECML